MIDLWTTCTTTADESLTCQDVRSVYKFFSTNYSATCGLGTELSPQATMMAQVYGWAEFPNCPGNIALKDTPGYADAIADFCSLQYNYLTNTPPASVFNPYTQLVHGTLGSNAYAFSIDDKAAFKSVPSDHAPFGFSLSRPNEGTHTYTPMSHSDARDASPAAPAPTRSIS